MTDFVTVMSLQAFNARLERPRVMFVKSRYSENYRISFIPNCVKPKIIT